MPPTCNLACLFPRWNFIEERPGLARVFFGGFSKTLGVR